jgi:alpha-beta hydrolase superfamily lysophospholipase
VTIQTELVELNTGDGETLQGALFSPRDSAARSGTALLGLHGIAGNFYRAPLARVGQALAERGWYFLAMNTRGHDWVCRAAGGGYAGAAYESFEDCLQDLDGALEWLGGQGYGRYVLFGHSLGGLKSLYYQGTRQRSDVAGVISCSAPRWYYSAWAESRADFPQRMDQAEALVAGGRGDELVSLPAGGSAGIATARTFVSMYGRHERTDVRPHAARLTCPLLSTAGGAEADAYTSYARELAEAAGPEKGSCHIVEGAAHSYDGRVPVLTDVVAQWLQRVVR